MAISRGANLINNLIAIWLPRSRLLCCLSAVLFIAMVAFYLPVICIIYCYNREIGAMERMASASSVIPTLNSCECIINKAVLLFIRIHLADKSLSPSIAS